MSLTTMSERSIYYEEESQSDRLARKSKETPFFPIDLIDSVTCKVNFNFNTKFYPIGLCTAAVGYGAYAYKNRGKMSTSVYLMHLRVGAQGAAVGSLTLGLLYTMINQYLIKKKE